MGTYRKQPAYPQERLILQPIGFLKSLPHERQAAAA
jgi:hypothetical protein